MTVRVRHEVLVPKPGTVVFRTLGRSWGIWIRLTASAEGDEPGCHSERRHAPVPETEGRLDPERRTRPVRPGAREEDRATVRLTEATALVLSDQVAARIGADEVGPLALGLRLALERGGLAMPPAVIAVEALAFAETDYQPNGLSAAGYAWVAAAFELDLPPIEVRFDGEANAYLIDFPAG